MKQIVVWSLLTVSAISLADNLKFKGGGTMNFIVPRSQSAYSATIEVVEIAKDADDKEAHRVTETYPGVGDKKAIVVSADWHLKNDLSLDIRRKGTSVGCGYCYEYQKGEKRWCNYEIHMEQRGKMRGSKYLDKNPTDKPGTIHVSRIGDMIDPVHGFGHFQDDFTAEVK